MKTLFLSTNMQMLGKGGRGSRAGEGVVVATSGALVMDEQQVIDLGLTDAVNEEAYGWHIAQEG